MARLADSTSLAGHQLVNLPLPLLQHAEAARLWQQGGGLRLQSETQGEGCINELGRDHSTCSRRSCSMQKHRDAWSQGIACGCRKEAAMGAVAGSIGRQS